MESGDPRLANLRLTDSRETEVGALPSSLVTASSKFKDTKYSAPDPLMLLSDPLLANLRLTDSRETEVGLFLLLCQLVANLRPQNTVLRVRKYFLWIRIRGSVNLNYVSGSEIRRIRILPGHFVRKKMLSHRYHVPSK